MNHILRAFPAFLLFAAPALHAQHADTYRICTELPPVDPYEAVVLDDLPPQFTARAVAYKPELGKYWENGKILKVKFLGGSDFVRSKVRQYAREWSGVANVTFLFVDRGDADIRIGFNERSGTWSAIGTDARRIPQNQASMNYGWFDERTPDWEFRATILHEFGHSLGLLHEHQHPKEGIPWDKPKLYEYYRTSQGWTRDMVDQQVLAKLNANQTQYSAYDPHSIMHYPIPNALTVGDFEIRMNRDLSPTDRAFVGRLYPKRNATSIADDDDDHGASRPTTTTTTPARPYKPVTTSNPTNSRPRIASVTVRDQLATGQRYEMVSVTVNGITRRFVLDSKENRRAQQVNFDIPTNQPVEYEVYTKTIALVRGDGGGRQEKLINGVGRGTLNASGNGCFTLMMGKQLNSRWVEVQLVPCN